MGILRQNILSRTRMKPYLNCSNEGPLKAGSLILEEKPFAFVLSAKEQGFRCDHCFIKCKVLKCSGCQYVHYCGLICQKDAWPDHKFECAGYRRVLPRVPPDAARLMARLVRKLAAGGGHHKGYYTKTSFRLWKDLMSHYQDLKVDNRRMDHFTSLCAVLFQFLTDITLPNSAELLAIYGRMCINGFTILDPEMLSIGTGIYIGTSIIDHSCDPNAVAVFNGTTINIRTLVDMPSLDWSKIRISYIDLLNTPFDRQSELQTTYYFLCQCERCLDEHQMSLMHAAKCPNPHCDYPVQIPWREDVKLVKLAEGAAEKEKDARADVSNGGGEEADNGPIHQRLPYERNGTNCDSTVNNGCANIENRCVVDNNLCSRINYALSMDRNNGLDSDDEEEDQHQLSVLQCPKCKTIIKEDFVKRFKDVMEFTYLHLQNMKDKSITYVDVCRTCLERQRDVLHPLSLFHVQTLDFAMDGCLQHNLWDHATTYAHLLLPGFKNYYGERHPLYGMLLLKLGKLLLYQDKPEEALGYLEDAAKVLAITHGTKHQLWKESLMPLTLQAKQT